MNKKCRKSSTSSVGSSRLRISNTRMSKTADLSSTFSKLTETQPIKDAIPKINYVDEIVLVFYNSMLETIIERWETIPFDSSDATKQPKEVVSLKDFRELRNEDFIGTEVVTVNGSQVSFTRRPLLARTSSKTSATDFKQTSATKHLSMSISSVNTDSRIGRQSLDKSKSSIRSKSYSNFMKGLTTTASTNTVDDVISSTPSSIVRDADWLLKTEDEHVRITFKNGNVYEGDVSKKVMHGNGKYFWANGAVYEGEFKDGYPTGKGAIVLPDLSYYNGEFCQGLFHGEGVFCIANTPMIYSGFWKGGKKHGKGWLLYGPRNWYEGEWYQDKRQGMGLRQYTSGAVYKGMWHDNLQHGLGSMIYCNNDFYRGEWVNGQPHGYGEYTWNAFYNDTLTFPIENIYRGSWENGMRNGVGLMHFGSNGGTKMAGVWENNLKHGPGMVICGNGRIIENVRLFFNDKPIQKTNSAMSIGRENIEDSKLGENQNKERHPKGKKNKSSLQLIVKQINKKHSSKKLDAKVIKSMSNNNQRDLLHKCNPLKIAIHVVPEETNFDYYIQALIEKYANMESSHYTRVYKSDLSISSASDESSRSSEQNIFTGWPLHNANCADQNNCDMPKVTHIEIPCYQTEEKQLQCAVISNLSRLRQIYEKYATLTSSRSLNFNPVLIRLFMWQMWRDFGVVEKGFSLIDIDLLLNESPSIGFENVHYPFEKIYFWQFLHALVIISQQLYVNENHTLEAGNGVLGTALDKFVKECMLPNHFHRGGHSLFSYRDLLPIKNVYLLYRSIGEPHTARKFLQATCVKKKAHPPCHLKLLHDKAVNKLIIGTNAVTVGENIMYLTQDYTQLPPENRDPFYKELLTFRKLGPKKIVQCLADVCPSISKGGFVTNMDYLLTFLEFYDTFLLCAFTVVDKKLRVKVQMEVQEPSEDKVIIEIEKIKTPTSSQQKKGQKKKQPKGK